MLDYISSGDKESAGDSWQIRRFHFDQIAKMATRLDAIPGGDVTMLDSPDVPRFQHAGTARRLKQSGERLWDVEMRAEVLKLQRE